MEKYQYLLGVYEDVESLYGYSGVNKLLKYVKENGRGDITKNDIQDFLKKQEGWTLHGNVPRRFVRRPIKVCRPGLILGVDLADMTERIAKHNNNYRYIMVMIDCFSRKLHLTPMKNKTNLTTARALDLKKKSRYQYLLIFSDEGGELLGSHTQRVYERFNITRYSVKNRKFKCSIAERVIRTVKEKLYKYFTQNNTLKYIEV